MNALYNQVQYVVPENSEIVFIIAPETRDVSLKLLDGVANICLNDKPIRLPLQQEFPIPFWKCLSPRLKTKTDCSLLVRGYHYISSAVQHGFGENSLFAVFSSENTYSFVLDKDIQLQIFPIQSAKESAITVKCSRGAPEVSGFKFHPKKTYSLSPYSPILLKSSDEKPFSVYIKGLNRKVKVSMLDENHHKCLNDVKDHIFSKCLLAKKFKHTSPTILVLGPKNVGKTLFCRSLANDALEKRMTPIYVDLNIKRNLSIPGSLSLSEIEGRIDNSPDFKYNIQRLLHYGSIDFHPVSMRFYYYLVQKMGGLLSFHTNFNNKENSLSIVDTDGYHGEHKAAIEIIVKSFAVDLVVYIGDRHYYENLKNTTLKNTPSEFIPKPCNTEKPIDSYEVAFYQHRIEKYFLSSTKNHPTRNVRFVPLHSFSIYRISTSSTNIEITTKEEQASDYKIERVTFNSSMINRLFAVSAAKRVELHGLSEVKYYVYFTAIDEASKMATVVCPDSENFTGGILLMGYILKLEEDELNLQSLYC